MEEIKGVGVAEDVNVSDLSDEERSERLAKVLSLIELMRPSVQADGGDLVLI